MIAIIIRFIRNTWLIGNSADVPNIIVKEA